MADDKSSSTDDKIPVSVRLREIQEESVKIQKYYYEKMKSFYEKRKEAFKSLPKFWLTAFMGHPKLGSMVSKEDQKIFEYFESLYVEETFDRGIRGYTITFNFKPNPFFENTMLSKTFKKLRSKVLTPTGTVINWKEGKGPIDGSEYEKVGNKRPLVEDSFFKWFTNEDDVLVGHDEVSELIRDELWPDPVKYLPSDDEDSVEGEDFERKCNEEEQEGEDDEDADGSKPDRKCNEEEEDGEDDEDADASKPDKEYNDEEEDGADDEDADGSKPDKEYNDEEEDGADDEDADGSKPDREYNDEEEDGADDEEMDSNKPDMEYNDDAEEEDDGSKPDGGYDAEEEDDEDDDGSESNI